MFCQTLTRRQPTYNPQNRRIYIVETVRDERELFVKTLSKLLRPVLDGAVSRILEREQVGGVELPIQEFLAEVVEDMLGQLYELSLKDSRLSIPMIPLMAYIRKAAKMSQNDEFGKAGK